MLFGLLKDESEHKIIDYLYGGYNEILCVYYEDIDQTVYYKNCKWGTSESGNPINCKMNKDELLDYVLHNLEYLPAIGFLWETSDNSEDFFYEIREYDVKHGDKIYNQQPISHVKWRKLIPTEKEELIFPEDFIDQLDGIIYQSHYEPKLYIYWK